MKAILGIKQDMTQIFDDESKKVVVCTAIKTASCVIAGFKTENDGYNSIVLGFGRKKNPTKPEIGKFQALGYVPMYLKEIRVDSIDGYKIRQPIKPSDFEQGSDIEIRGISKGKGFQGVVKRWHFHGGPKTHGQSDRQRAPGSIGMRTTPGRVFKGKKMPGRMGGDTVKINSTIVGNNDNDGYILVKGSVPGARTSILLISSK